MSNRQAPSITYSAAGLQSLLNEIKEKDATLVELREQVATLQSNNEGLTAAADSLWADNHTLQEQK